MTTYVNPSTGETYESAGPVLGLERSERWQRNDAAPADRVDPPRLTEKEQLVEDARTRDLEVSGTKDELRARIAAYDVEHAEPPVDPAAQQ